MILRCPGLGGRAVLCGLALWLAGVPAPTVALAKHAERAFVFGSAIYFRSEVGDPDGNGSRRTSRITTDVMLAHRFGALLLGL